MSSSGDPSQANSLKFALPNIKVPNLCDSDKRTYSETLYDICNKDSDYETENYISKKIEQAINEKKTKQINMIKVNKSAIFNLNLETDSNKLIMINFAIKDKSLKAGVALLDTGCEENLITEQFLDSVLSSKHFTPVNLTLVCINGEMQNSILGKIALQTHFFDDKNEKHTVIIEYLVVKSLGIFQCILGYKFFNMANMNISLSTTILKCPKKEYNTHFQYYHEKSYMCVSCKLTNEDFSLDIESEIYLSEEMESLDIIKGSHKCDNDRLIINLTNNSTSKISLAEGKIIGFVKNIINTANINNIRISENLKIDDYHDAEEDMKDFMETVIPAPLEIQESWSYKDCDIQGNEEIKSAFYNLLKNFQDIFAKNSLSVGLTEYIQHNIQLIPNGKLVSQKRRKIYGDKNEYCKKALAQWEEMKVIRKCHNPRLISNINVVSKPTDIYLDNTRAGKINDANIPTDFRITIDQRNLNSVTKNISSPITPTPDEIISKLRGKRVTAVDLKNAFYTIKINEECQDLTSFYFEDHIYCFNRLVMGLSSSPATYMRYMNIMFSKENFLITLDLMDHTKQKVLKENFEDFSDFICYYFDDLYLFTVEDQFVHLCALEAALHAIRLGGSVIGPKKTKFMQMSALF